MLDKEWNIFGHVRGYMPVWLPMFLNRQGILFLILGPNRFASHTDGEISAFYNACQHRGARIMVNERGWIKILCALTMVGRTVVTER